MQTRSIPATGHEYEEETAKYATCTEDGFVKYKCKKCGDTYAEVSHATGHDLWGWSVVKDPTCTEPGLEENECHNWNPDGTRCDYKETREIPATGHVWGDWTVTKEATCKEAGVETRKCTHDGCEATETREIPKLTEHQFDEGVVTKAATCAKEGVKTYTCKTCGETKTEVIPKTDHDYKEQTEKKKVVDKKAWDEEVKTTIYFCTGCGAEFKTSGELGKHIDDASAGKIDGHPGYGSMSDRVETKIVHHNEEFHYETVTKHVCKVCGHIKED